MKKVPDKSVFFFLIETDLQPASYFSRDSSISYINQFHELGLSAEVQT